MADAVDKKRKGGPGDDRDRNTKKSKGGNGGKWKTPHQETKTWVPRGSGRIEPGERGIFATCARGQEGRATEELKSMFEECAMRFYGYNSETKQGAEDEDDIEASIQREVAAIGDADEKKLFTSVHIDIQCVLFFRTAPVIDPVNFVYRICEEIRANPQIRRMKYANRLTPITLFGRATEKGLEEVGRKVIGDYFQLAGESGENSPGFSYALRPTTRQHTTLKRADIIKQVADLIGDTHKVNLTAPDKTILIEIYQTICGMSVVGSDWEAMKRFNLAELYASPTRTKSHGEVKVDASKVEEGKADASKVDPSKVEEAEVQEAKVEEPKVEEPKVEEANVDVSKVDEAKVEEAKGEEAKVEEAKVEEANVEEPNLEIQVQRLSQDAVVTETQQSGDVVGTSTA